MVLMPDMSEYFGRKSIGLLWWKPERSGEPLLQEYTKGRSTEQMVVGSDVKRVDPNQDCQVRAHRDSLNSTV